MAGVARPLDLGQFAAWADGAASRANGLSFEPALKRCKLVLVAETKKNFANARAPDGTPWRPLQGSRVRGGDKPLRDRGILMASVAAAGKGNIATIGPDQLVYGTNIAYARIHQSGGTIRPKGKALAIPATVEAMRAGSPRAFPGKLFIIWKKGDKSGGLYEQRGKNIKKQFTLVSSVTIPARPFLGWNAPMVDTCTKILVEFWEQQLDGRPGGGNGSG